MFAYVTQSRNLSSCSPQVRATVWTLLLQLIWSRVIQTQCDLHQSSEQGINLLIFCWCNNRILRIFFFLFFCHQLIFQFFCWINLRTGKEIFDVGKNILNICYLGFWLCRVVVVYRVPYIIIRPMRIEYWKKWYGVTHWLKMVWPMRVEYWWEKVVLIVSYVEN